MEWGWSFGVAGSVRGFITESNGLFVGSTITSRENAGGIAAGLTDMGEYWSGGLAMKRRSMIQSLLGLVVGAPVVAKLMPEPATTAKFAEFLVAANHEEGMLTYYKIQGAVLPLRVPMTIDFHNVPGPLRDADFGVSRKGAL
jgi:hypothetical protein